jgi:hypothetical protein
VGEEAMRNFIIFTLLSLSLLIFNPQKINAVDNDKEVQLEMLNITMNLVKSFPNGNVIKICFPEEPISLTAETTLVEGKTINELLQKNNILPDTEAYGVVYSLNPNVKKLSSLDVREIILPKIQGGEALNQLFNDGFQVLLTVDKGLKKQFSEEVKRLNETTQKVTGLEINKFSDAETRASVVNNLSGVSRLLSGINVRVVQRLGRPIPKEVLIQLIAETQILNSAIDTAISSEQKIGSAELEQIAAVKEDLDIKVKAFTEVAAGEPPLPYPVIMVSVKTLRNGQQVPNLRIYYVPKAFRNKPEKANSFGMLSPSSQSLPESGYCFWAARDPNRTAVSNVQCQPILRGQGTIEIQLTVIQ